MIVGRWRGPLVLFACLVGWLGLHHGAIRSPDAEVQVRACRAIATTGSSAIDRELTWRGFGMATGTDGGRYALFGPLQPLLCAPWWIVGASLDAPAPEPVRPSLYADGRVMPHVRRTPPPDRHRHAMRAWVSLFNVGVSLLCVAAFAWMAAALVSDASAWATALLFGLGTLTWHYSGTFFSEPLAITLDLVALGAALRVRGADGAGRTAEVSRAGDSRMWLLSGVAMGLAVCAHITAALFAPFVLLIVMGRGGSQRWRGGLLWSMACALPLAGLVGFNYARFGSLLETGRGVDPAASLRFGYGHWTSPLPGLSGLVLGASKGLAWYAPLTLVGLASWPGLRRRTPLVAWALLGACVLRLAFIAARSDWHGGFGLGPRLMLQAIPPLLLPIAVWLHDGKARIWGFAALFGGFAAAQQAWLQLGEPFAWFQLVRRAFVRRRIAAFAQDRIYLDWDVAPVLHLHAGPAGPWWMTSDQAAQSPWVWPVVLGAGVGVAALVWALRPAPSTPAVAPCLRSS